MAEKATTDQRVVVGRWASTLSAECIVSWPRWTGVSGRQWRNRQVSRSLAQRRDHHEISSTDDARRYQTEHCVRSGVRRTRNEQRDDHRTFL